MHIGAVGAIGSYAIGDRKYENRKKGPPALGGALGVIEARAGVAGLYDVRHTAAAPERRLLFFVLVTVFLCARYRLAPFFRPFRLQAEA